MLRYGYDIELFPNAYVTVIALRNKFYFQILLSFLLLARSLCFH